MIEIARLYDIVRWPVRQHPKRGYAQRFPPNTPGLKCQAAAPANAAPSLPLREEKQAPQEAEDRPRAAVAARSSTAAEDEWAVDEERISLMEKKTQ